MESIAIIADPAKRQQDAPLIKKAEELFDKALYVPVTEVRIETGESSAVRYKGTDLSKYSCVLPLPTYRHLDIYLAILKVLSTTGVYLPYSIDSLLLFQRKILAFAKLRKAGFQTLSVYSFVSEIPVENIVRKVAFPVEVRFGDKSAVVEDERHMRSTVKLRRPGQNIFIEGVAPEPVVGCFVVEEDVVASVLMEAGGKKKAAGFTVGNELKEAAAKAVSTLGSDYGFVSFSGGKVVGVSLYPDFSIIEKATNKSVSYSLLSYLKENIPTEKEAGVWKKLAKAFRLQRSVL